MKREPFSELTKHFTAEDWAYVDEGVAKIREEVAQERAKRAGRAGRDPVAGGEIAAASTQPVAGARRAPEGR